MTVPEDVRHRLSVWCADRVPEGEREQRQVGYTIQGNEVTIHDRRPPTYPELDASWPSVVVARLRHDDPSPGRWTLYEPAGADDWERAADGDDPVSLLDLLAG
jgi:hypothetical protein